jgi:hypothetical protein
MLRIKAVDILLNVTNNNGMDFVIEDYCVFIVKGMNFCILCKFLRDIKCEILAEFVVTFKPVSAGFLTFAKQQSLSR